MMVMMIEKKKEPRLHVRICVMYKENYLTKCFGRNGPPSGNFLFMAQQPLVGHDPFIVGASRSLSVRDTTVGGTPPDE
jgi:hypothetical protein